jgi:hypothetical protein
MRVASDCDLLCAAARHSQSNRHACRKAGHFRCLRRFVFEKTARVLGVAFPNAKCRFPFARDLRRPSFQRSRQLKAQGFPHEKRQPLIGGQGCAIFGLLISFSV